MKKKTIAIVSVTLVLALLAVAVIATFPTYLFEDDRKDNTSSQIESGNIVESDGTVGDDIGILGGDDNKDGVEAVLPTIDDEELGYSEPSSTDLEELAQTKNATLFAESGAFEDGTKVKLKKLGILNKSYYRARHYLKGISAEFEVYEISAKKSGKTVTPNGTVKLSFNIPDDYDIDNAAVYYLLSNGGIQELDIEVDKTNKTVSIKVSQLGVYILAEKEPISQTDSETSSGSTDSTSSDTSSTTSSITSSSTSSNGSEDSSSSASSTPSDTSSGSSSVTSSNTSSNSSEDSSSSASSTPSSTTSSDSSSDTSSDSSGSVSSDDSSSTTSSEENNSSDVSSDTSSDSDNTSSEDKNKDTMNGWSPWY